MIGKYISYGLLPLTDCLINIINTDQLFIKEYLSTKSEAHFLGLSLADWQGFEDRHTDQRSLLSFSAWKAFISTQRPKTNHHLSRIAMNCIVHKRYMLYSLILPWRYKDKTNCLSCLRNILQKRCSNLNFLFFKRLPSYGIYISQLVRFG